MVQSRPRLRHSNEKKSHKITIVQSASRQELENDTSLVKSEKVVVGILETEIVTKSDKRGGGLNLDFSSDVIYEWPLIHNAMIDAYNLLS